MINDEDYQQRFGGIARIYGNQALQQFSGSHVMVVGIGGVGSWVAESLARSGVGRITLIDLDDICVTNINRQIHALTDTIGQSKTAVMSGRLRAINPLIQVTEVANFLIPGNCAELITADIDYVVDAIDSVKSKAALIAHCRRSKKPFITIGGAGGKTEPAKIKVCDIAQATHDPLLAKVRSKLRKDYRIRDNSRGRLNVPCVFSTEQISYPPLESECPTQPTNSSFRLDCNTGFGSVSHLTATFAFFAVSETLKKLASQATTTSHAPG
mgnify:CR=1 FL=1